MQTKKKQKANLTIIITHRSFRIRKVAGWKKSTSYKKQLLILQTTRATNFKAIRKKKTKDKTNTKIQRYSPQSQFSFNFKPNAGHNTPF